MISVCTKQPVPMGSSVQMVHLNLENPARGAFLTLSNFYKQFILTFFEMVAKVVAFTHHKGGTGKTSSCISIAGYLVHADKRVLVIDLDPQANATSGLGVSAVKQTMFHVLNGWVSLQNTIVPTATEGIDLAPSSIDLAKCNKASYNKKADALQLHHVLKEVKHKYDYIFIDTAPNYGHFIINAALAADDVFLVADPGIFAVEGIATLQNAFHKYKAVQKKVNVSGIILNKCRSFPLLGGLTKDIKATLAKEQTTLFTVPLSDKIGYSQMAGLPISHYKPYCKAGMAYKKIAEFLL